MAVSEAYKKWYEKRKEQHNAKRRARYKEDEVYRSKVQGGIRSRRVKAKAVLPPKTEFYIKEACLMVGISSQKMRTWEAKGYIPKKLNDLGYRIYTQNQIALMAQFNNVLESTSDTQETKDLMVTEALNFMKGQWNGSHSE